MGECKKRRRGTRLWFSLSREAKSLDRIGKSSHKQFRILSEEEVTCFVDYDLFDNVLFVLQRLVLQQGGSGVPIRGFISAQLAELWALWRENVKLRGEDAVRQGFENDWNRALHNDPPLFDSIKPPDGHPRPNMQGSVSGKTDFSMSPDTSDTMQVCGNMMRSSALHLVSWTALSEAGFQGWWSPVESLVAVLQVGDRPVMFLRSTPWDGAPEGRLSVILQNTPTRDKHKVGVHLNGYNVFYSVLGEVHQPPAWKQAPDADPLAFVLFGRYRDNVYVLFSGIPAVHRGWVEYSVALFLRTVYGIPLKWEIHPDDGVNWGEAWVSVQPHRVSILRKGVCRSMAELCDPPLSVEWTRWVHPSSPNSRLIWQSFLPAAMAKCVWFAWDREDVRVNFRSLVWGLTVCQVPGVWWKARLRRFWDFWSLGRFFSVDEVFAWQAQARQARGETSSGSEEAP